MKKLLSLLLLLTPLISLSMDKPGKQVVRQDREAHAKEAALKKEASNAGELSLVKEEAKKAAAVDSNINASKKDASSIDNDERAAFIACLKDMRYFHLQSYELKETYKTVVKLAQMEQENLKNASSNSSMYVQWPAGGEILHRAQMQLADTIALVCPLEEFSQHVKTICGLIAKKHGSSNGKDVAVDMESFAVFSEILTNYDALTGTSFRDMSGKADEHLALRLVTKLALMKNASLGSTSGTLEKK